MSQTARAHRYFTSTTSNDRSAFAETIQVKVRRCIRAAGGLGGLNPDATDMPDGDDLKTNYHFSNRNYDSLYTRLNMLLRNENAPKRVSFAEVNECKTVADCVKLIQSKLS